jgi:hypothetical protein
MPAGGDEAVRTVSYQGGRDSSSGGLVFRAKREDPVPSEPSEKIAIPPTVVGEHTPAPYAGAESQFGADWCGDACSPDCTASSCFASCCETDGHGGRPGSFWVTGEYLLWGIKDSRFPVLVSASPVAVPMAGIVTTPGTVPVLGGNTPVDNETMSGGRFSLGFWLDSCQTYGVEAGFFWLGRRGNHFLDSSPGIPVVARPFLDVTRGVPFENAEIVASPNVLAGTVRVNTTSSLWGGDLNFRKHLLDGGICGYCYRGDLLAGIRYLELQEGLTITENLVVQPGANVPRLLTATGPATIGVMDQFRTTNQFLGGQIGFDGEMTHARWFLGLNGKLALGNMRETVDVRGATNISVPAINVVTTAPGGLLVQQSNMGRRSREQFALVPELGLKVGYNVTDHLRLFLGYNFLYMSSVARPGDQIDRAVNTSQLPTIIGAGTLMGSNHPGPIIRGTDFWAQGVSFGAELRY